MNLIVLSTLLSGDIQQAVMWKHHGGNNHTHYVLQNTVSHFRTSFLIQLRETFCLFLKQFSSYLWIQLDFLSSLKIMTSFFPICCIHFNLCLFKRFRTSEGLSNDSSRHKEENDTREIIIIFKRGPLGNCWPSVYESTSSESKTKCKMCWVTHTNDQHPSQLNQWSLA